MVKTSLENEILVLQENEWVVDSGSPLCSSLLYYTGELEGI